MLISDAIVTYTRAKTRNQMCFFYARKIAFGGTVNRPQQPVAYSIPTYLAKTDVQSKNKQKNSK